MVMIRDKIWVRVRVIISLGVAVSVRVSRVVEYSAFVPHLRNT